MPGLAAAILIAHSAQAQTAAQTAPQSPAGSAAAAQAPPATPPKPHLDLSVRGAFSDRSYVADTSADPASAPRTAVDRRLGSDALVGQVGYLCGIEAYAASSQDEGGGPLSGFGRRGTFLGASLGYAFR